MNELGDYLLHWNQYTGFWNAFKRGDVVGYWNGTLEPKQILKAKDINVIIGYITKSQGVVKKKNGRVGKEFVR